MNWGGGSLAPVDEKGDCGDSLAFSLEIGESYIAMSVNQPQSLIF
jgi:hypothetical protein